MKIQARIVEYKDVEIRADDFFMGICESYLVAIRRSGQYINGKGEWESWDDCNGHGSGLYKQHGKATTEEIRAMNAIKVINNTILPKIKE